MKKSCFIPDDRIYSLYAIILSLHIVLCNTIFPNKSSVYSLVAFAIENGGIFPLCRVHFLYESVFQAQSEAVVYRPFIFPPEQLPVKRRYLFRLIAGYILAHK